jgi:hypothetical protein
VLMGSDGKVVSGKLTFGVVMGSGRAGVGTLGTMGPSIPVWLPGLVLVS